ncbi:hypothetical protein ACFQ3P_22115 [Paraburkholderia sabiae]|jgi:hypothetical protein|uniref:DUF1640 domain-containing protein n=2 Tax=Paraburkholderia sabiae TaxID=273251 RepID=A0ABU9QDP3_9BURK|nr:hypothetical protein [Paraburkholderia sabiae]
MVPMETLEKPLAKRRFHTLRLIHGSVNMEARMTRAETTIEHILQDLEDLKREVRELRIYVDERFREFEAKMEARFSALEASMRIEFRLLWAANFAIVGLLAKGFHWI